MEIQNNGNNLDLSDKKSRLFIHKSGLEMVVIYERELKTYAKSGTIEKLQGVQVVTENNKIKWELHIFIKGLNKEVAVLMTSLNKPRQFPNLSRLVELVQDWCPNLSKFELLLITNSEN